MGASERTVGQADRRAAGTIISAGTISRLYRLEPWQDLSYDQEIELGDLALRAPILAKSDRIGYLDDQHLRVGVDMVRVTDVATSIDRFGDRYTGRLFTSHEVDCCCGEPGTMASGLAARYAAKEATLKVLRPQGHIPDWRSIEVRRHPQGWCDLRLADHAAHLARVAKITDMTLSLSHEGDMAIAVVIALRDLPHHRTNHILTAN